MTVRRSLIPRQVDARGTKLIIDIAGKVPVEQVSAASDAGIWGPGNQIQAVLVHGLEEEGCVVPGKIPPTLNKRIGLAVEGLSDLRVLEAAKIVCQSMEDHVTMLDGGARKAFYGFTADSLCESEC